MSIDDTELKRCLNMERSPPFICARRSNPSLKCPNSVILFSRFCIFQSLKFQSTQVRHFPGPPFSTFAIWSVGPSSSSHAFSGPSFSASPLASPPGDTTLPVFCGTLNLTQPNATQRNPAACFALSRSMTES